MIKCPKCGMHNNTMYCTRCGAKLSAANPAARKQPAARQQSRMPLYLVGAAALIVLVAMVVLMVLPSSGASLSGSGSLPSLARGGTAAAGTSGSSHSLRAVAVDGGISHSVVLFNDGTVYTLGDDTYAQRSTSGWSGITQISTFANHTLGLRRDGTVVAAGLNSDGQCNVSGWSNIVSVAAGSRHSVAVRSDGTVVAVGANDQGQCNVSGWTNVQAVAASNTSTFGLTRDGRILTCGSFSHGNFGSWSQIESISLSTNHIAVVHVNGTVSVAGANDQGQCDNMAKWSDTVMVACGYGFTAGLREKGSVWVHGCDAHNEHAAMHWTDMVAIGSGTEHILGIRADGTLKATGTNDYGQCDVYDLNQRILNS